MASQSIKKEDFVLKETKPKIAGREKQTGPQTSFDLVEHLNFLFIRIVRARRLPPIANPYVEIKLGNYRAVTKPFPKNPNPEWNQVYTFSKDRIQAVSVEILVKDAAVVAEGGGHGTIGKFSFLVNDVHTRAPPDSPLAPQWYLLEDSNKVKIPGELMLSFWNGTQADEAFPEAWHADSESVSGAGVSSTRSKIYMSPRLWYMRVNVIQAQDLLPREPGKKEGIEFLAKAQVGGLVLTSGVSKNKTVNPTWNEDLMFVVAEPFEQVLIVSVEERLSNKIEHCVGRIKIPLDRVAKRNDKTPASAQWYDLHLLELVDGAPKDAKFASKIQMRVSLDGGYHVQDEPADSASDLRPTAKPLWKPLIGKLELGILNATNLSPMKPNNRVDAYCVAKYGPKWVRTRTVVDDLSPKWNEQYSFEVYDHCTVITLGVFDNGSLQGEMPDLSIGRVKIRLSTMYANEIYTYNFPLVVLHPSGVKNMGSIQLAVRFTCESLKNMLMVYTKPLLPRMHFLLPLSVPQLSSLRKQAAWTLAGRLKRSDPPLKKEVVDFMLDTTTHLWSFRRGKANFERITKLLANFSAVSKWFDEVCRWKNPLTTLLVIATMFAVYFYPSEAMAGIFLCLIYFGGKNFRKRPKTIPHIDIELSHAVNVDLDELDEELDSYPTRHAGEVVRRRYDNLRGMAGRIQAVLGDIATQGERVEALLSWRDPRATALFLTLCLMAGIVFFSFDLGWILFGVGVYVFRPPNLRNGFPQLPQNLLRRMPAKSDSML